MNFFDIKGITDGLFMQLGMNIGFKVTEDESFHPGGGATLFLGDNQVGVVGELHPRVEEAFELSAHVYLLEVDLEKLLPVINRTREYEPLPRFPSITRDIALVVGKEITCERVENIIKGFPLVKQVSLFDLYSGEQVPSGKKSFAFRVVYQETTHTLTSEEVDKVQQQILDKLRRELEAVLRI